MIVASPSLNQMNTKVKIYFSYNRVVDRVRLGLPHAKVTSPKIGLGTGLGKIPR